MVIWRGISPLKGGPINPTIEPPEHTQAGKQTLGGHRQNLVHARTQEKGAVTPQETHPDLPLSVQDSPAGAWVGGDLCRVGGTECGSAYAQDVLEEVAIIFITSTMVCSQAPLLMEFSRQEYWNG